MKNLLAFILFIVFSFSLQGQDVDYARKVLNKLSSKGFHGRGYVKKGDQKAAAYLARQFKKDELLSFDSGYFQAYSFPINTFPGKVDVSINGIQLVPGQDFVLSCSAPSTEGTATIIRLPDTISTDSGFLQSIEPYQKQHVFLVSAYYPRKFYGKTLDGIEGIIVLTDKTPWWHVSNGDEVQGTIWLRVLKEAMSASAQQIEIHAQSVYELQHQTQNVIGFVRGKTHPERFIAFTAHYDHLGMMGKKTWFPGANDNASGTAMVADLARYYAQPENQPDYSIVFMLFSGEEAGLYGSNYYVEHPLFMLEQIDLLINLDMVGTGSDGITVVNGKAYGNVMDAFNKINEGNKYLADIKARGEACNSDHCPFYQKGVKSIFIYTRGKEHTAYHSVKDNNDDFPFTAYDGLFKLLTKYVDEIQE